MRASGIAACAALLSSCLPFVADGREISATTQGDWIRKFETLRCDPHAIRIASSEPLRFAAVGPCYQLPSRFRGGARDRLRAVTVDAARSEVRIVELGPRIVEADSIKGTPEGRWRWLAPASAPDSPPGSFNIMELGPGDAEPRVASRASLAFAPDGNVRAHRGSTCWLVSGASFALVGAEGWQSVLEAPSLRGASFWHAREQAFVVQTAGDGALYQLLDCDGNLRPLPESDTSRMQQLGKISRVAIAGNGDWAFEFASGAGFNDEFPDEIHVIQGNAHRQFGWFGTLGKGCPDINCNWDTDLLWRPQWSASGAFILVQGVPRLYVLRASNLQVMRKWFGSGAAVLLSDSLAMSLERNRGVTFYRW
jgi:hypothetical protein